VGLFVVVEEFADFGELGAGGFACGKRADEKRFSGAAEGAIEKVAGELALGPLARLCGFIDMGTLRFIAAHKTLIGHDLHEFESGAVLGGAAAADDIVDAADGGGADAPEDGEDFEFGVGGPRKIVAHNSKELLVRSSYVKRKVFSRRKAGGSAPNAFIFSC